MSSKLKLAGGDEDVDGKEEGHNRMGLESERGGGDGDMASSLLSLEKFGSSSPRFSAEAAAMTVDLEGLEKSIRNLTLEDGSKINRVELLAKLGMARSISSEEKRLARKAAWIAETRKEIQKRKLVRDSRMSELFPELAWIKILEKVEDPKQKADMSNAYLFWREMMKPDRAKFLFQALFELLQESKYLEDLDLSCRTVCKEWKRVMDVCLHNSSSFGFTLVWDGDDDGSRKSRKGLAPIFRKGQHVSHFLELTSNPMYSANRNPLILRMVTFGKLFQNDPELWVEVERFLNRFGREIWHVSMYADNSLGCFALYDELCKFLKLMPNLRTLAISGNMEHFELTRLLYFNKSLRSKDFDFHEPLKAHMRENPLPELPHLKTIGSGCGIVPVVMNELLNKYRSTVDTILFLGLVGDTFDLAGELRLTALKKCVITSENMAWAEARFKRGFWPSIEDFCLMDKSLEADEYPKLFRCLSGTGGDPLPLRNLVLSLNKEQGPPAKLDADMMKGLSLELPLVEKFFLTVSRCNLKTIDFILPMASLKDLKVCYKKYVSDAKKMNKTKAEHKPGPSSEFNLAEDSGDVIKFGSCINRLYESNIWELFPKLRKVSIVVEFRVKATMGMIEEKISEKEKIYSREGYIQYRHAQEGVTSSKTIK